MCSNHSAFIENLNIRVVITSDGHLHHPEADDRSFIRVVY